MTEFRDIFTLCIFFASFSTFVHIVVGCGYGAPQVPRVCRTLTPNHGVPGQNSPSPYTLTLDKVKIKPGEDVVLTVSGGPPFKGFVIQGRMIMRYGGGNPFPMGTFKPGSDNYKLLKCGGIPNSAATHTQPLDKETVSVTWTAPDVVGNYTLLATIAKAADVFWVAQPSAVIEVVYCVKQE